MTEPSEKLVAASNTGPLVSAFQCNRIDLLEHYFASIHFPPSVLAELEQHGAGNQIQKLRAQDFFQVEYLSAQEIIQARQIAEQIASSTLTRVRDPIRHLPEAEAIVLMQRLNLLVDLILVEEKAARQVAIDLNIPVTGFIGILLLACSDEHLSPEEMQGILDACRQQGTHYSDLLIAETIQRCRELNKQ